MKKKIIPVVLAIVLIIIIGCVSFGGMIIDKYSYSKERADLNAYYEISSDSDVAVVLQNEIIEERAKLIDGVYYFDIDTVHKYLNDRFYVDKNENLLLYSLPDDTMRTSIGSSIREDSLTSEDMGYVLSRFEGDILYIAIDYVKEYTNFGYEAFVEPNRIQLDTVWEDMQVAEIKKDTAVRLRGGVKSEILTDVSAGDKVTVLEQMETWTKVKTKDSIMGYVENKRLRDVRSELPIPVTDYEEPQYTSVTRDYKINMGWHVVAGEAGNDTIYEVTRNTKGLNVISPTWFKICDNEGNYTSFASKSYVETAHEMGMEVWALIENIEYRDSIDMYAILSSTTIRANLIDKLINEVLEKGIDGINVDFEQISVDCGEHYVQFIRELSIPCRQHGIVLSVDNYVPKGYNDHYGRKEQGVVADYVIIMGYDEHYAGSEVAGSVASIDFVEDGIAQTVAEVPANKVINALPFYTRIWETTPDSISSQAVGMEMAEEYVANHEIEIEWDDETCQNYGEYTVGDTIHQVWLEDEKSIQVKLTIMDKYGIGGVASWRLGFEKPEIWDEIVGYLNN
ncbi:MAG: SH3 domain-containing protein [Lachnospiraceae bacterium]|nr:SH3 domain-containing protein [Lachnospiraceae bacterium]